MTDEKAAEALRGALAAIEAAEEALRTSQAMKIALGGLIACMVESSPVLARRLKNLAVDLTIQSPAEAQDDSHGDLQRIYLLAAEILLSVTDGENWKKVTTLH